MNDRNVNFKLERVIENTVDAGMNTKQMQQKQKQKQVSLDKFYANYKNDVNKVGRTTTYDVLGQRNYKEHFNESKYKF
ncbi:ac55 [Lambdina fiscellaria nucleopolyhedrovirus]|uniref:Ac55 n=1 Tax=Lambdina fiscellaria nucleopolyhedrovirus TaxID=1642929 RepID=A0A0E3Z628_9ABAC|nr:ac55 [Lambdina fiscellaria nucleopolyhedrovirus]AKC91716.1 ac55 [Lambdina fiscellaria nucleopolyhedrovirus]